MWHTLSLPPREYSFSGQTLQDWSLEAEPALQPARSKVNAVVVRVPSAADVTVALLLLLLLLLEDENGMATELLNVPLPASAHPTETV